MASRVYEIFAGTPATASQVVTFIGTGSAGTPGAARILTHPNSLLAPITYLTNPDRSLNLDNVVLSAPLISTALTLEDRKVFRFESNLADTIVTEVWEASGPKAAMVAAQFRLFYEYWINPPPFDAVNQTYIQWEPRDRNALKFNVEIVNLSVGGGGRGGGDTSAQFDLNEIIPKGGVNDGGDTFMPLDSFDDSGSGLVDRNVVLQMKIVSQV